MQSPARSGVLLRLVYCFLLCECKLRLVQSGVSGRFHRMKRILITGGCGFIGSNFVRFELETYPQIEVYNLDLLTYAGNPDNLAEIAAVGRYRFIRDEVADPPLVDKLLSDGIDARVHFAAESHVDRSIHDSGPFVQTNIVGTQVLLDAAKAVGVKRYVQISTDEVYGSLGPTGSFSETTPLAPNSPYSASKAAADMLVFAYHHTFGLPTLITRCSNNYGPYQFPEKLIPLFVTNLLADQKVPLYGDGLNVRDWIHVDDHCDAILAVLEKAAPGSLYNIGGHCELRNIDIARRILLELKLDE